jgi:predicted N-acetyltransferase YhbS
VIIRHAQAGDIDPALAAMSDAFGLELRAPTVHTLAAESPDGALLVAEDDGVIRGTAASLAFGATAWLGGVTVTPQARGNGLGRQLTEAAIDALGERETILLLASAMGRPIYEKLGFEAEGTYRVFFSGAAKPEKTVELRDVTPEDREAILALDRRATGEDRALAIDASL